MKAILLIESLNHDGETYLHEFLEDIYKEGGYKIGLRFKGLLTTHILDIFDQVGTHPDHEITDHQAIAIGILSHFVEGLRTYKYGTFTTRKLEGEQKLRHIFLRILTNTSNSRYLFEEGKKLARYILDNLQDSRGYHVGDEKAKNELKNFVKGFSLGL